MGEAQVRADLGRGRSATPAVGLTRHLSLRLGLRPGRAGRDSDVGHAALPSAELGKGLARGVKVGALSHASANVFLPRNVVANLELAGYRQRLQLHVDGSVAVHERD